MNINELNRIKVVNIDEKLASVERNSGTFKELLEKVMDGTIIPLVNNAGDIVGLNYDTKATNLIDDNIEQHKFSIQYSGKPVFKWFDKALEIKASGKAISEVIESIEEGIKVIMMDGEAIEVEAAKLEDTPKATISLKEKLPKDLYIDADEIDDLMGAHNWDVETAVKKYLRSTYGHYLSKSEEAPSITLVDDYDEDAEEDIQLYHVSNISWGRKI